MPVWRREIHQEISNEQRLLESMGGWFDLKMLTTQP
jgi:hypothetical protein